MKKIPLVSNPNVLSIAGSDPSAGAGIQADIKTICALGGYACTAITALTVQNTQGVRSINPVNADLLLQQCEAIFEDIDIASVKIGMLPNEESVEIVAGVLKKYNPSFVVWDPVMESTSGNSLVTSDITDILLNELLPLVHVVTPNLHELAQLTSSKEAALTDEGKVEAQCHALLNRGAKVVLAKGGHFKGNEAVDWLFSEGLEQRYVKPRIDTENTHGSGCTLSSAIACLRPQLPNITETVAAAKNYTQTAIEDAKNWKLGKGRGPLSHFNSAAYLFSAA